MWMGFNGMLIEVFVVCDEMLNLSVLVVECCADGGDIFSSSSSW